MLTMNLRFCHPRGVKYLLKWFNTSENAEDMLERHVTLWFPFSLLDSLEMN